MRLLIRPVLICSALAALALAGCGGPGTPDKDTEPGPLAAELAPRKAAAKPPAAVPVPYVVIRFDRPGVRFEDALYTALGRALDRHPAALFDVVLAMPPLTPGANPEEALRRGEQHIEAVVLSMTDMGLPAERLRIAAATDPAVRNHEIRIFVH